MPSRSSDRQATTLILLRHGETDANVNGTWQGATDEPLNARGRAQAQALAQRLAGWGLADSPIYSSPLGRAQETAQAIGDALGDQPAVTLEAGLAEYDLGDWEGSTYEELRHEKRLWDRMAQDPHFAPPNGESAVAFATRVVGALQAVTGRHPGQVVIVVGHGGALATALAMLLEGDADRWPAYRMANCAISELILEPQPRLARLNETSHLDSVGYQENW